MRLIVSTSFFFILFSLVCSQKTTHQLMMGIEIDGKDAGEIEVALFGEVVPKTVKNFKALCLGEKKKNKKGVVLNYKGAPFHRILPNFMIQGGDITNQDGTGGISIYSSSSMFEDENFELSHSYGSLSMANSGKDSNGSQFFITLENTPWLDGKHVVFGKVIGNMKLVHKIESYGSPSGRPSKRITISGCREVPIMDNLSDKIVHTIKEAVNSYIYDL